MFVVLMNKRDLAKSLAPAIRDLEKITGEAVSVTVRAKDGDFLVGDFSERKEDYVVELSPNTTPCFTELNGAYSSYKKVQDIFRGHKELTIYAHLEDEPYKLESKIKVYWVGGGGAWAGVVKVPVLGSKELPSVSKISDRDF